MKKHPRFLWALVFTLSFFGLSYKVQAYDLNSLFPKTVKEATGRDYLTTPFPKPQATNTILCPLNIKEGEDVYAAYGVCKTRGTSEFVDKLPTYPYSSPIKNFVGRYLDGAGQLTNKGEWFHFYGGENIKFVPGKNRIYMLQGSTLVAYKLDNFFTRIATEPLRFFYRPIVSGGTYLVEAMIPWADYFYAAKPSDSGWRLYYGDINNFLFDYDIDDRGFLYLGTVSGWGIIKDDGTTLRPVSEMLVGHDKDEVSVGARGSNKIFKLDSGSKFDQIFSIKAGTKYYVATTSMNNNSSMDLWDVTDPYNPKYFRSENSHGGYGVSLVQTRVGAKQIIALLDTPSSLSGAGFQRINIYDAEEFISGTGTAKTFELPGGAQGYHGLTTDPATGRIFTIAYGHDAEPRKMSIVVFTPTAGAGATGYKETSYVLDRSSVESSDMFRGGGTPKQTDFTAWKLSYDSGLLSVLGTRFGTYNPGPGIGMFTDLKVWDMKTGAPKEIDFKDYFFKRYSEPQESYAIAQAFRGVVNGQTYATQGKTYLFLSTYGQGDVYEIDASGVVSSTPATPADNGCVAGGTYSTITGTPCVCFAQQFTLGAKGDDVKALQQKLKDAGLYKGRVDGIYGKLTSAAEFAYCKSVLNPTYSTQPKPVTNVAPLISNIQGPSFLEIDELGSWTVSATDSNEDNLSWAVNWGEGRSSMFCTNATSRLAGAELGKSQNWSYSASHSWSMPGKYTVTFYANDCKQGAASKTFTVTVSGTSRNDGQDDLRNKE